MSTAELPARCQKCALACLHPAACALHACSPTNRLGVFLICLQPSSRLTSEWAAWRSMAGQMLLLWAMPRWPPPQQQADGRVVHVPPRQNSRTSSSGSSRQQQTAGRRALATGCRVPALIVSCRRRPSLPRPQHSSRGSCLMAHASGASSSPPLAQAHPGQSYRATRSIRSSATCRQPRVAGWHRVCGGTVRQRAGQQQRQQVLGHLAAARRLRCQQRLLSSSSR